MIVVYGIILPVIRALPVVLCLIVDFSIVWLGFDLRCALDCDCFY